MNSHKAALIPWTIELHIAMWRLAERLAERLSQSAVSEEKKKYIMKTCKSIRMPMLHGLPEKTVKRLLNEYPPYTWKGSKSLSNLVDSCESCLSWESALNTSNVADLRALHLTRRRRNFRYAFEDRDLVTREASKFLCEERASMKLHTKRFIQLPGCTKGKYDPAVGRPRAARQEAQHTTKHQPTNLSYDANVDDIDEEDDEAMQAYYGYLCETFDGDPSKTVFDEEFTRSSIEEPDDYDIEMAKAEEDGLFGDLHEDAPSSGEPTSDLVNTDEINKQTKRKRESAPSPEPPTEDLSDHVDRDLKRRRLEIGTESSQASPSELPKKRRREGPGKLEPHYLFCRSSSLAAVFEAAIAVEALEPPQVGSSSASGLDAVDLELLGEEHNDSEQKQTRSSVNENLKLILGEALYPLVSHDDLQVAKAGAALLEMQQGNSNAPGLEPADREALLGAFGASDQGTESGLWSKPTAV